VMGISHTARLVLPKVLALAVALPLVTLWTSVVMLAGGMLAAKVQLGMDPLQFLRALPAAVPAANLALGFGKAAGFGALVALVACHFGLRVKPDTESLAAGTTSSVVSAITAVIMLDALVAVIFSDVGIS
jgi:phospholipid/cholesterol/gamma-HCH transport system permease protein